DYFRGPAGWTHLGAFVDTALQGGLWEVLARKAAMWLRLSAAPAAGLILLALLAIWLARRGAFAALKTKAYRGIALRKPLTWGVATALVAGSLVNDSGLVVAVAGLATAGPLAAAAAIRAAAR
ncbi:MAG: hypothetical protein LBD90_06205, partial [Bifidobacteriaceae bacterium]|nr:hypothetical protein [Bifidobacteriaceae bacterium]